MGGHTQWISLVDVPTEPIELVALSDPAIDAEALERDDKAVDEAHARGETERVSIRNRYGRDRNWKALPLCPGATPTVYHVRPLTDAQLDEAQFAAMSQPALYKRALQVGCVQIVAPIWDGQEHLVRELPRNLWPRIPIEQRLELGLRVVALSQPPKVPPPPGEST